MAESRSRDAFPRPVFRFRHCTHFPQPGGSAFSYEAAPTQRSDNSSRTYLP
jgi:hypothetical protein